MSKAICASRRPSARGWRRRLCDKRTFAAHYRHLSHTRPERQEAHRRVAFLCPSARIRQTRGWRIPDVRRPFHRLVSRRIPRASLQGCGERHRLVHFMAWCGSPDLVRFRVVLRLRRYCSASRLAFLPPRPALTSKYALRPIPIRAACSLWEIIMASEAASSRAARSRGCRVVLPPASCFFESSKACRNCANVNDDRGFAGIVSFLCVSCRRRREAGAVGCASKGPLPHTTGVCCTPRSAGHATRGRRCGSRESAARDADPGVCRLRHVFLTNACLGGWLVLKNAAFGAPPTLLRLVSSEAARD